MIAQSALLMRKAFIDCGHRENPRRACAPRDIEKEGPRLPSRLASATGA